MTADSQGLETFSGTNRCYRETMKQLKNSNDTLSDRPMNDQADVVVDENFFKRMLSLERRRCERTESRFALMLLDVEELRSTLPEPKIEELARTIGAAMRETDITGWYEHLSTIGVILTTLNG